MFALLYNEFASLRSTQSLRGLFEADFFDDLEEATQTESQVASPMMRSEVDPIRNCKWIGLPLTEQKAYHEGTVERSELQTCTNFT